ncbi:hypothetical protein AB1N83_012586, partial [Pleurotus pulmonarius]
LPPSFPPPALVSLPHPSPRTFIYALPSSLQPSPSAIPHSPAISSADLLPMSSRRRLDALACCLRSL